MSAQRKSISPPALNFIANAFAVLGPCCRRKILEVKVVLAVFTVWVLSHLLRLLPKKIEEESIRTKITSTVTEILQSVKLRSLYFFSKLTFELIALLAGKMRNFLLS